MRRRPRRSSTTDKIDLEVNAESAGVLARIDRKDGDDVKVGEVLAHRRKAGDATRPTRRNLTQHRPTGSARPAVGA